MYRYFLWGLLLGVLGSDCDLGHKRDVRYRLMSATYMFCYESLNVISSVPEKIVHRRVES